MKPGKGAVFTPWSVRAMKRTMARPAGGTLAISAPAAFEGPRRSRFLRARAPGRSARARRLVRAIPGAPRVSTVSRIIRSAADQLSLVSWRASASSDADDTIRSYATNLTQRQLPAIVPAHDHSSSGNNGARNVVPVRVKPSTTGATTAVSRMSSLRRTDAAVADRTAPAPCQSRSAVLPVSMWRRGQRHRGAGGLSHSAGL
jgi:hypothetical protein